MPVRQQIRDRRFYLVMAIALDRPRVPRLRGGLDHLKGYFGDATADATNSRACNCLYDLDVFLHRTDSPHCLESAGYPSAYRVRGRCACVGHGGLGIYGCFAKGKTRRWLGGQDPDVVFLVALGDILTFAIFVASGFVWRRNRETHQRLMLLAKRIAGLQAAAIPRLPLIGVIGGNFTWDDDYGVGIPTRRPCLRSRLAASHPSGVHLGCPFRFRHDSARWYEAGLRPRLARHRQMAGQPYLRAGNWRVA